MGASLSAIEKVLAHVRRRDRVPLKILDVGCQNLYRADVNDVVGFLQKWGPSYDPAKLLAYANMVSSGSEIDPVVGGLNGVWLGDLLSRAGFHYRSYDIFAGYRTRIFDLNKDSPPKDDLAAFDAVLNFGTSEHVMNQWNCFKVIHDAAGPGGIMFHRLPLTGFLNHGYFNYQPRFFFDLAQANCYEIIDISIGAPAGLESMQDRILEPYRKAGISVTGDPAAWRCDIPTGSITAVFRKITATPFSALLEVSTTAGFVELAARESCESDDDAESGAANSKKPDEIAGKQRALLARLEDPRLTHEEIMHFYRIFVAVPRKNEFPLELEKKSLSLALVRWPERADLRLRLAQVEQLILQTFPLLSVEADAAIVELAFDGLETGLRNVVESDVRSRQIIAAYKVYFSRGLARDFPAELEYQGITCAIREFGATSFLKLRLGKLLSRLTQSFQM